MKPKKLVVIRTVLIFLTLIVMAVIFLLSADDADESNKKSDFLADSVVYALLATFDLDDKQIEEFLDKAVTVIRNTAHFAEYGALGFLLSATGISFYIRTPVYISASSLAGILYAVSDEIHQYFVPGRSFQLTDILIDSAGVLCGVVLVEFIVVIYKKQ